LRWIGYFELRNFGLLDCVSSKIYLRIEIVGSVDNLFFCIEG
jgi:hypothetical protein